MANTALTAAARNAVTAATELFCGRRYRQGFIGHGGKKCLLQRARLRTEELRFGAENIASEAFLLRRKRMLDPHRIPPAGAQKLKVSKLRPIRIN
jgi:hypothetical protein